MEKVASTDRLGRLISLVGSAIDLAREGKRSAEETDALLDALQRFKDPNQAPKPTIGCCGYPHYDDPKRPVIIDQIKSLCQLKIGEQIVWTNKIRGGIGKYEILSRPTQDKRGIWLLSVVGVFQGVRFGHQQELSLEHYSVVPFPTNTGGKWEDLNYLTFTRESTNH